MNVMLYFKRMLLLGIILTVTAWVLKAQTPAYYNNTNGTSSNVFPLATTTSNQVQWCYAPAVFNSNGTTGAPAFQGLITTVYFRTNGAASATYTNFEIKLGQTIGTVTGFSGAAGARAYETGLTTVFFANSHTINAPAGWVGVTLQTPFLYNPALALVFEMRQSAYTGGGPTMAQENITGVNQRIWGLYGNTSGTTGTGLVNFGFDLLPSGPCTAPPTAGTLAPTQNPVCPNVAFSLGLVGSVFGTGQTYEWQSSPNNTTYTTLGTTTVPSYSFPTGITAAAWYRCIVTCNSQSDTTQPVQVNVNSFLSCYCNNSSATSTADEDIFNVTFGTLNSSSTCASTGGPGSVLNLYSNYTQTVAPPSVQQLQTVPFSVTIGTCGGNFSNAFKIFIDWNRNGLLTDPGEEAFVSTVNNGPFTQGGNITVPLNSSPGLTLMRVVNVETTVLTNILPCGTYTWGETEDYLINIIPAIPCSGTPVAGTTVSSRAFVCAGDPFLLSLNGSTQASGLSYQWQVSPDSLNWTDVNGATGLTLSTNQPATSFYRCQLTCGTSATVASVPVKVVSPLLVQGFFTIDKTQPTGGTNFSSFADAVNYISCGIGGPVQFDVLNGPYNERVVIPNINGTSQVNTITFDGGANKEVVVNNVASTTDRATVLLNGADFVTLRNLTIRATNPSFGFGIQITNNSNDNIIESCVVSTDSTQLSTNFAGIVLGGQFATTTGNHGSRNLIFFNEVYGGYYGITMIGASTAAFGRRNLVAYNRLQGCSVYGIYQYFQDSATITNNYIRMSPQTSTITYPVYTLNSNRFDLSGNTILNYLQYGMYFSGANNNNNPLGDKALISNNMISGSNNSVSTANGGIYLAGTCSNLSIFHNSISVASTSTSTRAMGNATGTASVNLDVRNNSFAVFGGTTGFGYFATNAGTHSALDYNNYFTPDTASIVSVGGVAGTPSSYRTLAGANSQFGDPFYINNRYDLHSKGIQLNDRGDNAVGVTSDIDFDSRPFGSSTQVDIGADEFEPPGNDAGVVTLLSPTLPVCPGTYPVKVLIENAGRNMLQSVIVKWSVNGVAQTPDTLTNLTLNQRDTLSVTLGSVSIATGPLYTLTFFTENPNGQGDEDNRNDTLRLINLRTGFPGGTYTIDKTQPTGSGNFNSFADAISELNTYGICGAVVFNVINGPYNEHVVLPEIKGASATNTITFDGGANKTKVFTTAVTTINRGTFTLRGADFVTIRNFNIENYDPSFAVGIHIYNEANDNLIEGNFIRIDTLRSSTSTNFIGIQVAGQAWTTLNPTANNLIIFGNHIRGGYAGISITYAATTVLGQNNLIQDNIIEEAYNYGIRGYAQNTLQIIGNKIRLRTTGQSAIPTFGYGIYLGYCDAFRLISNEIRDPLQYGIYMFASNYQGGNPTTGALVVNNMISGRYTATTPYGIFVATQVGLVRFYHNSISVTSGTGRSFFTTTGTTVVQLGLRNNSFASFGTTARTQTVQISTASSVTDFDYNNFHSNNDTTALLSMGGVNYTAGTFRGALGFNANSRFGNPNYRNNFSNLRAIGLQLWEGGDNNVGITEDIDNDQRPLNVNVDIGADEYTPPANEAAFTEFVSPNTAGCGISGLTPVTIRFFNQGTSPVTNFTTGYSVNNGTPVTQTVTGVNIPSGAFYSYTFPAQVNLVGASSFRFDGWVQVAGDTLTFNDSIINHIVYLIPLVSTYPYFQDFEASQGGWIAFPNVAGQPNSWQWARPNGSVINSASSGVKAWCTDSAATTFYSNNEQSYVVSPCFDMSSLVRPNVRLRAWWNSEFSWDGMVLQSTINGGQTWQTVGSFNSPGSTNWYNDNTVTGLIWTGSQDGWSGNATTGSGGWRTAHHKIANLAGQSSVRFRLAFGSDASGNAFDGVAFDDFEIYDDPANDLGAGSILSPKNGQCGDSTTLVTVEIENLGILPQTNFPIVVQVDTNGVSLQTFNYIYPGTLAVNAKDTVTVGVINTHYGPTLRITAYTNLASDQDRSKDTIRTTMTIRPIPNPPVAIGGSSCEPDSFKLYINQNGQSHAWYDQIGGAPIAYGDTLQTPFLTNTQTYYAGVFAQSGGSLTTTIAGGNGQSGNMFDLVNLSPTPLTIDSLFQHITTTGSVLAEVYYLTAGGSYVGNNANANLWTLAWGGLITSAGPNQWTTLPVNNITIPVGGTLGMYVTLSAGTVAYTTLTGPQTYQNSDLRIEVGIGVAYPFGGTFNPRAWNGVVHYSAGGCSSRLTPVQAQILPPPFVNLGPDQIVCGGLQLDAGPQAAYRWNTGDTTRTISANSTGLYTVEVTGSSGCKGNDTISVSVLPAPTVNLGPDITACNSVSLNAGNPGATYIWSNGNTNQQVTVTQSNTYAVLVTNQQGCSGSDTIMVSIQSGPPVDLGPDIITCSSAQLDAGNTGIGYQWSNNATTQTITVTQSGNYTVTVTGSNGCTTVDDIFVSILPPPSVNLGSDTTFCDRYTLNAGNPGLLYNWSTGPTSQSITVTQSGTYSVTVTDISGCVGTDEVMVNIITKPLASFSSVQNAGALTVAFNNNSTSSAPNPTYRWDFGDFAGTSALRNPSYTYAFPGTYIVKLTVTNRCGSTDYLDTLYVFGVGLDDALLNNSIALYPNPSKGLVFVTVKDLDADVELEVYDARGSLVLSDKVHRFEQDMPKRFDLSAQAKGVYLMSFRSGERQATRRIVLE